MTAITDLFVRQSHFEDDLRNGIGCFGHRLLVKRQGATVLPAPEVVARERQRHLSDAEARAKPQRRLDGRRHREAVSLGERLARKAHEVGDRLICKPRFFRRRLDVVGTRVVDATHDGVRVRHPHRRARVGGALPYREPVLG
ncbi:MAG TPA: hypothetical protein DC060_08705 [Gemmatimonadetes bacterium]|nr:hypothetical protein [Gemmatimonadota bacterium]